MSSLDNKKACRHGFFSEYLVPAFKFQKIFVFIVQKIFGVHSGLSKKSSIFVFCLFPYRISNSFRKPIE